jgi:anti-sigma regulatory factor (Ser/Thr protein kinase)
VNTWTHSQSWSADVTAVAAARHFVSTSLLSHGCDTFMADASLVVSELATNAVLHAGTPFTVTVEGRDGSVLVTVRDGSATYPSQPTVELFTPHGRGLRIVDGLSLDWGVSPAVGGKSVWAALAEGPAGVGA